MREVRVQKKGIIGPVISVFVMVLVVSILAGLTFLFAAQLKNNVSDVTTKSTATVLNETGWINSTGYTLTETTALAYSNPSITLVANGTGDGATVPAANYTLIGNVIYNATAYNVPTANISYTYSYIADADATAYNAVNDTEAAGSTIVNYLSLIFLAIIFGAILTLVLRIILPYINLGQQMGGF